MYRGIISKTDILDRIHYAKDGKSFSCKLYPHKLESRYRVPADRAGFHSFRWTEAVAREMYMILKGFREPLKNGAPWVYTGPTFDTRLMESELLIEKVLRNSWEYGNGLESSLPLKTEINIADGFLVSIEDQGKGFDPSAEAEKSSKKIEIFRKRQIEEKQKKSHVVFLDNRDMNPVPFGFRTGFDVFMTIPYIDIGFNRKGNEIYITGSKIIN